MKKITLTVLTMLLSASFYAEAAIPTYSFKEHIKKIKVELKQKKYDASVIDKVFNNNFVLDVKVKKALKNQPEIRNTFDKYMSGKLATFRVNEGRELYKKHYNFLKQLESKYGVDPEVIVALWGLETNYGKYPIKYSPVKSLVSMSYTHKKKRRRDYFKAELFSLFELNKKYNLDLLETKSSWAGALGQCQFMPSNVLKYAVDGDSDGKSDIWSNELDVLASIANFLKVLKWRQHETDFVTFNNNNFVKKQRYNRKYMTVDKWQKLGLDLVLQDKLLKLKIYHPKNKLNNIFLVSKNFAIIKKWNNSDYFAFSVLSLAKEIKND
ncbi:MAG: lytic murein transglycosylase [Proteobacteria bacterium]|nr:lytic murein transglycosylase [Pseudomonadota bacterium]